MIAKITKGGSAGGLGRYLHGPGHHNEHVYDTEAHGRVIGGSMGREGDADSKRWARMMDRLANKRSDIDKPIWHASLSAAKTDPVMGDAQWEKIAREYMRDLGLEHNPWVVVRHDPGHVHIVASRINGDGSVWNMHNDHYRSQRATRAIEERHDLQRVPSRAQTRPHAAHASELTHPVERALKARQEPSWRSHIKRAVESAAQGTRTPQAFTQALREQGVNIYANKRGDLVYQTQTKQGPRKITGHKLGADYHGGRISEHLGKPPNPTGPTPDQISAYLGTGRRELAAIRDAERAAQARRVREWELAAAKAAERAELSALSLNPARLHQANQRTQRGPTL